MPQTIKFEKYHKMWYSYKHKRLVFNRSSNCNIVYFILKFNNLFLYKLFKKMDFKWMHTVESSLCVFLIKICDGTSLKSLVSIKYMYSIVLFDKLLYTISSIPTSYMNRKTI